MHEFIGEKVPHYSECQDLNFFALSFFKVHYIATYLGWSGLLMDIINIQAALHSQKAPNSS